MPRGELSNLAARKRCAGVFPARFASLLLRCIRGSRFYGGQALNDSERQRRSRLGRNVVALGWVSLLTDTSTEIVYPLVPLFLTALGAGPLFVGLVEGVAETTASVLKAVAGWWSDRLGHRKRIVVAGYTLSSATRPLMALAIWPWHVLAARFIDRVGKGIRTAPRDALLAASAEQQGRGRVFGFHRAMDHAGAVLGPIIAFILLGEVSGASATAADTYRAVFWVATIPAVFAVATLAVFVREVAVPPASNRGSAPRLLAPLDRRFYRYLGVAALFTLGNSSDAFLLLRASECGVRGELIPLLWAMLHVVKSATSMPAGAWSDRIGRKPALAAGWGVYAVVYLGFAVARADWQIWTLFGLYGVYFGLTEGAEKAFVADLVEPPMRATAYGLHGFAVGMVALPASLLMGWLWTAWSAPAAFLVGAVLALVAGGLLLSAVPAPRSGQRG
ncbi:MAG: MFS transporter [Deltaproteobacteria bacterium]|nr:MAG: MFS transporter [Deltaproteobacteria bacterium]